MRQATFQAKTTRSTRVFQERSAAEHDSVSMEPPEYGIELADGRPGEKVVPLPVAPIIQTKLMIGPPDDEYEQEADRVAESVMRMPGSASPGKPDEQEKKIEPGTVQTKPLAAQITPFVQRQTDAGDPDNKEEEDRVQLERLGPNRVPSQSCSDCPGDFRLPAFSQGPNNQADAGRRKTEPWLRRMSAEPTSNGGGMEGAARFAIQHKGPGKAIPSGTRNRLEASTGADLNHVRVHTDPVAHIAADHLQARAFTHRRNIWLGRGESPTDLRLMAHETTHVLQQDDGVHRQIFEVVQRRATGSNAAGDSGPSSVAASPAAASPAVPAATPPVAVAPLPAVGIAAPAPQAVTPSTEMPASVEAPAPAGAVPAEPGGEIELLMPEPPEGPSEADRQRLENVGENASDAAAAQRDLPSAEENVTEAREAVDEPIEETAGRAEGGLAAALSTRPEPSPTIEALCERILALIHSRQPPDEESVLQSNPQEEAEAAGGVLESSVEGDVDQVERSYDQLDNPPAGTSQQTGQSLESPATSVNTPAIGSEQAVPDAVPAENVSLDADVEASAARMDEAGMTSEPAQLVQSGPIAEARAAQGELAATAQRDPAEVLAEQQLAREQAGADMADLQARALETLQASRAGSARDIGSQQTGMVLSEELLRTQLSTEARGIFTAAQERVDILLEPLTRTAMQRWETGVEVLSTQFEHELDVVKRRLAERYEGWTGAVVEFAEDVVGKPAWVTWAYDRAERNFADGVCALIREISTEVNSVIAACQEIIDDANTQIAEVFAGDMPEGLREWAAAEQARFTEELQGLRNRVNSTRDEFNNNLAERAAQAVQEVRERIHALREAARGLVGRIADAIGQFIDDPVRFIIDGLLELVGIPPPSFWALINRIQSVISDIADNPMNFANNLMAALAQGFQRFFDNFADHILSGFFEWLFSGLGAVGVEIPRDFSLKSIITFFLQLMGITWPRIRELLARYIGEENVALLERAYEIIANLIEMGPEGIFEMIKEQLNPQNILDQVLQAAIDYLVETLIVRVTARIMMMLNPAGAIVQAIEAIYRVLRWIFDNAARIFSLVETVVNGAAALIAGDIGGMAAAVEGALARLIAPVIDFLAGYLGLGNLPDRIADTIRGFQEWVMSILERVIAWLADRARALLQALGIGGEEDDATVSGTESERHEQIADRIYQELSSETDEDSNIDELLTQKRGEARQLHQTYAPRLGEGLALIIELNRVESEEDRPGLDLEVIIRPNTTRRGYRIHHRQPGVLTERFDQLIEHALDGLTDVMYAGDDMEEGEQNTSANVGSLTRGIQRTIGRIQRDYGGAVRGADNLISVGGGEFFIDQVRNNYVYPNSRAVRAGVTETGGRTTTVNPVTGYDYLRFRTITVGRLYSLLDSVSSGRSTPPDQTAMLIASIAAEPFRYGPSHITNLILLTDYERHSEPAFSAMAMTTGGSDPTGSENVAVDPEGRGTVPAGVRTRQIDIVRGNHELYGRLQTFYSQHEEMGDSELVARFQNIIRDFLNRQSRNM